MILALVDNDRQRRRQLQMIIRPLSDEFLDSSPEAPAPGSYRLEPSSLPSRTRVNEQLDREG